MKKKLLIFHPFLATYRIDLYNKLAKLYDLTVALYGSPKTLNSLGFDLEAVNNRAEFNYKYYRGLWFRDHLCSSFYFNLFRRIKPDVVLTHELGLNTLLAIFLKRIFKFKIFTTIDDSPDMALNYSSRREKLRRFVYSKVNGVIVVNPKVRDFLRVKYKNLNCRFLYMPIIQDDIIFSKKIQFTNTQIKSLKEKYKLKGYKTLLFVGRLETVKDPMLLIDSFAKIKGNAKLFIIGDGSLLETAKNKVKEKNLDNVYILGKLTGKELYIWYNIANIFVLPSRFEPFGAVVNESLISGCFTIVSDKVGANCLINNNNGIVIQSDNLESLTKGLQFAIDKVTTDKEIVSLMPKSFNDFFKDFHDFIENLI